MSTTSPISGASAECRILPTSEAIAYVEQHGSSLRRHQETRAIPSNCATGYPLANGEIVLLDNSLRDRYPALIFSTAAAFEACCRADQFPLPPAYLTWGEVHMAAVGRFLSEPAVYATPLHAVVQVEAPFATLTAMEDAYIRVRTYLRRKSLPWEMREPVANAFALAVTQFWVAEGNFVCELRKCYMAFNPYYDPCLRRLDDSSNGQRSVFGSLVLVSKSGYKVPFENFLWWVTGISQTEQTRNRLHKE
jgi:hypothetical protein